MKRRLGLIVAAVLVVSAAPPAFARSRHHQQSRLVGQEMRITESPTDEPIVAPPVTVPDASVYDTPLAKVVGVMPMLPEAVAADAASTLACPAPQLEAAGPPAPAKLALTPGALLFDQTHDDSALDPINWAVSVYKKRHELDVYYKGRLFKRYAAVFGRNLDLGAKLWAQDRRTPEGVYSIVEKYQSVRFHWFLRLNYPNLVDRVRYETMRVNGVVPVDHDGKSPEVGSAIGIHGTDVPILNAGRINWTTGCISVDNKDIDDLDRLLPLGTVVIIKP